MNHMLKKEDLNSLVKALLKKYEVIAPVSTDAVRFEAVKDPSVMVISEHSYIPPKVHLFRGKQALFEFSSNKVKMPKLSKKPRVIIGLKRCDLNSIHRQDMMFLKVTDDPYYRAERERTLLIGYQCKEPASHYCFCGSMELGDFHDIMLFDKGDYYLVEALSAKGKEFVSNHKSYFMAGKESVRPKDRLVPGTDRLKKKDISYLYDNPGWEEGVERCFSCAGCVLLCPSCYCFDIYDEVETSNLEKGRRMRRHSACQLLDFTKVAGGHIFRKERSARFRHRIYHQMVWFRERHGISLCTGCARCIKHCPTRIDFVEMINKM